MYMHIIEIQNTFFSERQSDHHKIDAKICAALTTNSATQPEAPISLNILFYSFEKEAEPVEKKKKAESRYTSFCYTRLAQEQFCEINGNIIKRLE